MEYTMVLASARQTFGIIMIIIMLFITFASPMLVTKLTRSEASKNQAKQKKRCTAKIKGNIIDMRYNVPPEYRDIHDDNGPTVRTIANYEFFVNGVRYTGSDYIYNFPGQRTVDVLYDPSNPSNNCTPWGRKVDNGTEHIIPIFIVLGVIVAIFLFILLAIRFLNSF